MKTRPAALSAALAAGCAAALLFASAPAAAKKSKTKSGKGSSMDGFGPVEPFYQDWDFMRVESPESIVFDSKGNAYVSLTLNAYVSVLSPEGEEITQVPLPQGDCRPTVPTETSFPLSTLQFGMAMDKDDNLYISLLACAEGFPWPEVPNLNTGLWKMDTTTYELTQLYQIPEADGRGRQQFCCDWMEAHWPDVAAMQTDPTYLFVTSFFLFPPFYDGDELVPLFDKDDEGRCIPNLSCTLYEAAIGSALFGLAPFQGYAQIWNGVEVIGDYIYTTNSYFHEIWRMPKDGSGAPELWLPYGGNGEVPFGNNVHTIRNKNTMFTAAGFNGLEYYDGHIYVANTAQGKIVKIPMLEADGGDEDDGMMDSKGKGKKKGSKGMKSGKKITKLIKKTGGADLVPGVPELVNFGGDSDEFVLDVEGNIYAAQFEDNRVVKIYPNGTEEIIVSGQLPDGDVCAPDLSTDIKPDINEGFSFEVDLPTSVAFGTTKESKTTLFIANSGFLFFKSCAARPPYYNAFPGITKVEVGVKGAKTLF